MADTVVCVMDDDLYRRVKRDLTDAAAAALGLRVDVVGDRDIAAFRPDARIIAIIVDVRTGERRDRAQAIAAAFGGAELIALFFPAREPDPVTMAFLGRCFHCRPSHANAIGNLRGAVHRLITER